MSIPFGDVIFPDKLYDRAMEGITVTDDGHEHWIWMGAKSGTRNIPQIGCTIKDSSGNKKVKVVSVAKLLYVVEHDLFPYQIRRDKSRCKEKNCVNPDHFYAILDKPEPRRPGNRSQRVTRIRL